MKYLIGIIIWILVGAVFASTIKKYLTFLPSW